MAIPSTSSKSSLQEDSNKYFLPLATVTLLFFAWGFITSMNDVLIPKLKLAFDLTYFQSMLIQFCFFFAYFITSAIYYLLSVSRGDPILKMGYKNAIVIGLLIAAVGSLLFYPAASLHSYPLFLVALFILASGITILQIGANPYVTLLGKSETASGRLNLTQAFNSLGTTIAPLIGGNLILGTAASQLEGAHAIKLPYLVTTILLLLMAVVIKMARLPRVIHDEEKEGLISSGSLIKKYRQLKYGVVAIFMYVGGEVSIGSLIVNFLADTNIVGISESQAAKFLSLYWSGAMIGRFFGAIFLSDTARKIKLGLILSVLIGAFYYSGWIADFSPEVVQYFWMLILLNLGAFFVGTNMPHRTLTVFSLFVVLSLLIGSLTSSDLAMWSVIGIGLFNSIMFPTIFSLAVRDLHRDTSQGASLLIMAIVGGAIIPLIQGWVADVTNVQYSYLVPLICYVYLTFYGINGYKEMDG
ncbi:MAG: sugar MFS transporter [Flavobacteriales bacterium AspAUS03]